LVGGPFPARLTALLESCPAFDCFAGEMPSSREGDRYIFGCAFRRSNLHPAVFPVFNPPVPEPLIWLRQPTHPAGFS
jgi:hypothetical protein